MTKQEKLKETLRIFMLADTHNRLPEKVKEIAKGADEIWHLGDVCAESIAWELRQQFRVAAGSRSCTGWTEIPLTTYPASRIA